MSATQGLTATLTSAQERFRQLWQLCVQHCLAWVKSSPTIELPRHRVQITRQLADGATGIVYLAHSIPARRPFALKRILAQSAEQVTQTVWEIQCHKEFRHPHLMPLRDSLRQIDHTRPSQTEFLLLFPFCELGSLDVELTKRSLPEGELLQLFHGVCLGLLAMHSHQPPLAHRDIKPGNVMLWRRADGSLRPMLTDFGSTAPARVHVQSRRQAMQLQEWAATNCTMCVG